MTKRTYELTIAAYKKEEIDIFENSSEKKIKFDDFS